MFKKTNKNVVPLNNMDLYFKKEEATFFSSSSAFTDPSSSWHFFRGDIFWNICSTWWWSVLFSLKRIQETLQKESMALKMIRKKTKLKTQLKFCFMHLFCQRPKEAIKPEYPTLYSKINSTEAILSCYIAWGRVTL